MIYSIVDRRYGGGAFRVRLGAKPCGFPGDRGLFRKGTFALWYLMKGQLYHGRYLPPGTPWALAYLGTGCLTSAAFGDRTGREGEGGDIPINADSSPRSTIWRRRRSLRQDDSEGKDCAAVLCGCIYNVRRSMGRRRSPSTSNLIVKARSYGMWRTAPICWRNASCTTLPGDGARRTTKNILPGYHAAQEVRPVVIPHLCTTALRPGSWKTARCVSLTIRAGKAYGHTSLQGKRRGDQEKEGKTPKWYGKLVSLQANQGIGLYVLAQRRGLQMRFLLTRKGPQAGMKETYLK